MEGALAHLDRAADRFHSIQRVDLVAETQVPKLMALAMLGRYDEALDCGQSALEAFLRTDQALAAGKVELNLGHIYFRREAYAEAELFYARAYQRFDRLGSTEWLIAAQIALADVLAWQHRFAEASSLYAQAERRAGAGGLSVLEATSAMNAGHLALLQGHYDRALRDLERARRLYEQLQLSADVALCEQKIADAYLELNLIPEAIAIYERITPQFADMALPFEHAWVLTHFGRALLQSGRNADARRILAEARSQFRAQGNRLCEAIATLALAQAEFAEQGFDQAAALALETEPIFQTGNWQSWLGMARWLRAECARRLGDRQRAKDLLETTLREAADLPHIAQRCEASLGAAALDGGDSADAERHFLRAVELTEGQRARLPGEEFRASFLADKLLPYTGLVQLCLEAHPPRIFEALCFVERSRSRALLEVMRGDLPSPESLTGTDEDWRRQTEKLRTELNWLYGQLQLTLNTAQPDLARIERLHSEVHHRERDLLDLLRRTQHTQDRPNGSGLSTLQDEDTLHAALGEDTALIAYSTLGDELLAFVAAGGYLRVHRHLATVEQVESLVGRLRFQLDAMRYGVARLQTHFPQLLSRSHYYLHQLYRLLLQPILPSLGHQRVVIVPAGALYYLPLHALWDGQQYVIEDREVCVAPSVTILLECLSRPVRPLRHAVLVGASDARAPLIEQEVAGVAALFPSALRLTGDCATMEHLRACAAQADVLHLACHGQFRPDNPLFSALMLADGRLTVQDAYGLELRGTLVTLSGCETGLSKVGAGDELIGLARGFFAAGAPSLAVSLWTVDDAMTTALMQKFYAALLAQQRPAAALRQAQLQMLRENPHPFFWAPFALYGRW